MPIDMTVNCASAKPEAARLRPLARGVAGLATLNFKLDQRVHSQVNENGWEGHEGAPVMRAKNGGPPLSYMT